jgi:hypothetical protein
VYGVKLLLDEMYAGLKEYFETLGYEVLTAQEAGLKAAKDKDVMISNAKIAKIADAEIKQKFC